ncbi:uncharacterized protein KIAA1755 homolog [Ambystoma mexicanum]|uniref:uncharacterized protein KIAA1755 homolog n=1 Tax=Ambystoma mexicanum TaxID=8296 RepID=UPI0037E78D19
MNSLSLDSAVQRALSALYPPFAATAATVLSQVFRIIETDYQGDGLRCLLDFVIPAKRQFELIQQAACAPYPGRLFVHEGWPLCLHEKVVVHLAPLSPFLLRPGDFFFHAKANGEQSVCVLLKCLSDDLRTVEEIPVRDSSYPGLFSNKWLEEVNRGRVEAPLHTCLLATDSGIAKVPWSSVAVPEFVDEPVGEQVEGQTKVSLQTDDLAIIESNEKPQPYLQSQATLRATDLQMTPSDVTVDVKNSVYLGDTSPGHRWNQDRGDFPSTVNKPALVHTPIPSENIVEDLEGDYVDLLELPEEIQVDLLSRPLCSADKTLSSRTMQGSTEGTQVPCHSTRGRSKPFPLASGDLSGGLAPERWTCRKAPESEKGACTPCLRRKLNIEPKSQETVCRFRESYMQAIQNPVSFGSGQMNSISEETNESKQELYSSCTVSAASPQTMSRAMKREGQPILFHGSPQADVIQKPQRGEKTKASTNLTRSIAEIDSSEGTDKFLFLNGQRALSPTEDTLSSSVETPGAQQGMPWKRMSSVCSPRLGRAKPVGKDIDRSGAADLEVTLVQKLESKNGLWISIVGSPIRGARETEALPIQAIPCQDLSAKLLYSGIACLPGSRDKHGRAVIQVTTDSTAWAAPWCTVREVARLLLYLCSIPRKDVKSLGLLIVVDARQKLPPAALYSALRTVQVSAPGLISTWLVLVEKEAAGLIERIPGLQVEVLTSPKGLGRYVDNGQLTWDLGGTFPYCHSEWVQFCQKLDPFVEDLKKAADSLQGSIREVEQSNILADQQEPSQCITQHRERMKLVLTDTKLVNLQKDGGATLARLRKEAARFCFSEDVRDAVESAVALYNQVEEQVHTLVTKSNRSLELLESLVKIKELEWEFSQLSSWIDREGEEQLRDLGAVEWSLESLETSHRTFQEFFAQATAYYSHGQVLCNEANKFKGSEFTATEDFKSVTSAFQVKLTTFYVSAERLRDELETMLTLYRCCDKISWMTFDCSRFLAQLKPDESGLSSPEMLQCLEKCLERFEVELSPERLQEMKKQAYALSSCKGLALWNETWLKCQETKQLLEDTMEKSRSAQRVNDPGCFTEENHSLGDAKSGSLETEAYSHSRTLAVQLNEDSSEYRESKEEWRPRGMTGAESTIITCCNFGLRSDARESRVAQKKVTRNGKGKQQKRLKDGGILAVPQGFTTSGEAISKTIHGDDREAVTQNTNNEALENLHIPPQHCPQSPPSPSCCPNNRSLTCPPLSRSYSDDSCSLTAPQFHSPRKVVQNAQNFHLTRHASFSTEDSSSQYSLEDNSSRHPWARRMTLETMPQESQATSHQDNANFAKLRRILEELLTTERDYVGSLGYVVAHYIPEMERADLPQGLRGQLPAIFGNLERLYEFHSQLFLQELNACWRDPLRVGRCFLRHKERFGLYAFYSKNKPQSDLLLVEHGAAFFQRKQLELGDKMDLSSYLLKPIQRISKYNLLLEDMLRECSFSRDKARAELHAAQEVVRFQLRHGNDLLAMEDIQDCDVNLKEQGQLMRQGEFLVSYRKKKCFRRIFLFQDLILFSKTKKSVHGNETYIYKQSFKTSEIGLTHSSGGSGLCFEIWFRRRKSQDTYTLQAPSVDMKESWTTDLQKILWDQAITNREVRRQERIFSGLGCKPFTDIQPSEAAISDRAVTCAHSGKDGKSGPSSDQASSMYHDSLFAQRSKSNGSGSSAGSASSLGGKSSSSSGRGSLSPHGFLPSGAPEISGCFYGLHACPEEGGAAHETDGPLFLTDSSASSEGSVSGFSSSDPSCLSLIGREADEGSSSSTVLPPLSPHPPPRPAPPAGRRDYSLPQHPMKG